MKTNQLVLPKDRPVEFRINTKDVLHDFWVPEFRLKSDAVPGITTKIRAHPVAHRQLRRRLRRAVRHRPLDDAPGRARGRPAAPTTPGSPRSSRSAARRRRAAGGDQRPTARQLFTDTGCNACHTLADAGSTASVGPDLDELAADAAKYGKQEGQTPEEYVEGVDRGPERVRRPRASTRASCPTTYKDQLSPEEIDTLVKYLLDVGGGEGK